MKVLPVVFLTVAVVAPNVAEAQSLAYGGQSYPSYNIMAGPNGPRLPVFYDPSTGEWRTPLYECPPEMMSAPSRSATVSVSEQPPLTRVHLSPAKRFTILNQQGRILAFNEETGELFRFEAGDKIGRWQRLSDTIPTMPLDPTLPAPVPIPGPAADG